jgi:hypothetical protein
VPVEAMVCLGEVEDVFLLMFSVGMMTLIFLFMVIHYGLPVFFSIISLMLYLLGYIELFFFIICHLHAVFVFVVELNLGFWPLNIV